MASPNTIKHHRAEKRIPQVVSMGPMGRVHRRNSSDTSVEGINRAQFRRLVRDPSVTKVEPLFLRGKEALRRTFPYPVPKLDLPLIED